MTDRQTTHVAASQGKGIFRNSLFNFLGQVLPLGIAAVAVPTILRDMGLERYGLLSLSWILLGYFTFLDMGLGRATTNAVADLHSSGNHDQIGSVVNVSLALNLLAGIVGGVIGWSITPWLVDHAFAVPDALRAEATAMFSVLSLSIPLITIAATLRGVLEGFRRFDLSNLVKSPSLALMFLLPLLYKPWGLDMADVVGLIVGSRFAAILVLAWLVWKVDRKAFMMRALHSGSLKQLLGYAGWITLSNAFTPVLMYAERLLLAALVPLGMVGFYTAPYEIISRIPMIPASVGTTLFPSFSAVSRDSGRASLGDLFVRPTRFILFVVTPPAAVFVFFPNEILRLWLGNEFAARSHDLFVLLAAGFFFNCLAHVPLAAVLGLGRPDLKAKVDVAEAFLFAGVSYVMISSWGITGAAVAKAAVLSLDAVLMFVLVKRMMSVGVRSFMPLPLLLAIASSIGFLGIGLFLDLISTGLLFRVLAFAVVCSGFVLLIITRLLTPEEKTAIPLLRRLWS